MLTEQNIEQTVVFPLHLSTSVSPKGVSSYQWRTSLAKGLIEECWASGGGCPGSVDCLTLLDGSGRPQSQWWETPFFFLAGGKWSFLSMSCKPGRKCGTGSSVSCPKSSLLSTGYFLIMSLAFPILTLGTGWLLYFVPFGWMHWPAAIMWLQFLQRREGFWNE